MPGMLRAFVAVEMSEPVRSALQDVQAGLKQIKVRARWVRPENIHLTLKFLGNIPAGHVPSIGQALMEAARPHGPLSLTAAGMGVFPGLRRPRVIWVGLADRTDALGRLQRDIDARLAALGFPREAKRFRGHVTIGRFAESGSPGPVADALDRYRTQVVGALAVHEVVLFRSDLRPEGPVYAPLVRAPLGSAE
jgi:2'-5' RNA ligase